MNSIRKVILISLILTFSFSIFSSVAISAQNLTDAFKITNGNNNDPLDVAASQAGYDTNRDDIKPFIGTVIQVALSMLGVIFLVLMIYGGYLWMTAHGNEENVTKAKDLITAAIVGLIIVISAYAISYFVINALGTNLK